MSEESRRESFKAWMAEHGLTDYAIAKKTGIPEPTIRAYRNGKIRTMKTERAELLAQAYRTTVRAIFELGFPSNNLVPVMGKIGARADVWPFDDPQAQYEVDVPPGLEPDDYVAFEIEGFSMPPARPGWLVFFRRIQRPMKDLEGFPCLVDLTDGRRLFKDLRRGYTPGKWNLISWDGSEPMEDQDVVAALPFVCMTPGKMAR